MANFIGDYHCKLDTKGRVVFPAALKKQVDSAAGEKFVIKKDIFENCLVIYPMDEWKRQNELIRARINPYNKQHNRFLRGFYKGTAELELDGNNRLLLPKRLLDAVNIDREVVLAGQDSRIEVWAKEQYEQIAPSEDEFAELAEKIMGTDSLNDQNSK
jgi:MraZ protein